ncbi:MAG: translocation/assembly module TamB domain-containing protein [Candidatus Handelsmanbacteria bacterium]|nr:translocation/assembly module TamB domain-containing protein [Candidatus Handelsmanbacteria bacterium]
MTFPRAPWLGLALGLVLLGLATPAGPWLIGRGLVQLAPHWGWRLHLGSTSGALAGRVSIRDLRVAGPGDSLRFTAEELSFSPWDRALALRRPVLELLLGAEADTSAADTAGLRLAISSYPSLDLSQGALHLTQPADSTAVHLTGLEARYRPTGDTTGSLQLRLARWQVIQGGAEQAAGDLQGELQLEPDRLALTRLQAHIQSGHTRFDTQAQGSLGLGRTLPASFRLQTELQADSLRAQLRLDLEGGLRPLDTRLLLEGQFTLPALGPLGLRARGILDTLRLVVETLHLEAAGGLARGRLAYGLDADSLALELRLDHLDLSRLSAAKGQVDALLQVQANLGAQRYTGGLDLWGRQLALLPGPPLDARFQARLHPGHLLEAALDSPLGRLQATGPVSPSGDCDLQLAGVLHPGPLLGYSAPPVQLQGRARPDSLQLRLDSPDLPLQGISLGPVEAELSLVEGRRLETTLVAAGDQVQARLRADLAESRLDTFALALAALPLARFDTSLAGTLGGQLSASGGFDLASLRLGGQFQLSEVAYQGWKAGDLDLELQQTANRGQLRLSGQGVGAAFLLDRGDRLEGQLEMDQARFRHTPGDSLSLSGHLHLDGRLSAPAKIAAAGLLSHLALRQEGWGMRLADTLRFTYADQRLRCDPFALLTPAGTLHLEGGGGPDMLAVEGHIDTLDLGNWSSSLTGTGQLGFSLGGAISQPVLRAQANLEQLKLGGNPVGWMQVQLDLADTLRFAADLEQDGDQEREFDLDLAAPATPLLAGGDATDAQLSLRLRARQADLRAPLSLLLADSLGGQLSLDGDLQLPLSLLADPRRWQGLGGQLRFGQFQLDKPGLRLRLQDPATLSLRHDHLEVEELALLLDRFDPAGNHLQEAGALSLKGCFSPAAPFQLQLDLRGLDLRALETWNQEEAAMPAGQASLQARFAGTLTDPDLDAALQIDTEDLGRIEGRFRGDEAEGGLQLVWLALGGDSLEVSAQLPWSLGEGLVHWDRGQGRVYSSGFSLLPLLDQLPQFERLDGTLSTDLALAGFGEDLRLSGWAAIEDLELRPLDVKPSYFFPAGRIEFAGQRGELRDFVGGPLKGEGRAELSGHLELAALDSLVYDLRLQARDLPLNYADIFVAPGIDLDGSLSSTPAGSLLRCQVRIDRAQAEVPLFDPSTPVPPPPAAVRDPFLENMQLELTVNLRDLQVENELSELQVEGFSRVYGSFYKPQFQGGLEIPSGKVALLNSEFAFQKGRVSLDRPAPTYSLLDLAYEPLLFNPDLDVELGTTVRLSGDDAAELDADECKVTLKLQGPALQVVPVFSSEPAMPEQDLIRLLAFGSIQQSQGEREVFFTAASQLLLSRQVKKIGLDQFQILPSGTLLETVGKPSVRMGKFFKFPLPLQVSYEAATALPSEGQFRVEHKVGPYLTLTGAAQSKYQRYGLGVGLKKDFR